MPEIGTVLSGRYRLMELLGQGGMATIYRAHDLQLDRDVAVKLLRPEYGRDPDFSSRFRQEAQSAASLNHPGIVSVYDYGQDEIGPFIVMELVDGEDLATLVRRTGALPPKQAARIVAEVARALAVAHARGIVHRDVKPGNVMLAQDGRPKVADFGIARALAEAQMTLPGTTLGSVHYFSPEQVRGEPATASSDAYSLGIVLYELLTGRRPWEGDSAASIAMARLTAQPPAPSDVRPGVPPALDAIVRKALALEPEDRFASAEAMADTLERFLGVPAGDSEGAVADSDSAVTGMAAAQTAREAAMAAAIGGGREAQAVATPGAGGAGGTAGRTQSPPMARPATSGVAHANPGARVRYPSDAYARPAPATPPVPPGASAAAAQRDHEEEPGPGPSVWVWLSGLLALALLVLVGFVAFRLLSAPSAPPPAATVVVPSFVGLTLDQAQTTASQLGLVITTTTDPASSAAQGTVVAQDLPPNTQVNKGSPVKLTLAGGQQLATVPSLRFKSIADAVQALIDAHLKRGKETSDFDPVVPSGEISSQSIVAGTEVPFDTPIDYVVSKGPAPTPTPTLTASPEPTPSPSEEVTPPPTEPPTPEPSVELTPPPTEEPSPS